MQQHEERVAVALDHVAETAEGTAHDQLRAAALARSTARKWRDSSATDPGDAPQVRLVLDLVTDSARRLAAAAAELRRVWAALLATRGLSVRQIGERLGVSHQRVSALLAGRRGNLARSGQQ